MNRKSTNLKHTYDKNYKPLIHKLINPEPTNLKPTDPLTLIPKSENACTVNLQTLNTLTLNSQTLNPQNLNQ